MTNKKMLLGVCVILAFFFLYRITSPKPLTRDECYRLESNLRMVACLDEIDKREAKYKTPEPSPDLYVSSAMVPVIKTQTGTGTNPAVYVTVKNNSNFAVENVILKFTYFPKDQTTCNGTPLDTENLVFYDAIGKGDTKLLTVYPESVVFKTPSTYCVISLGAEKLL